MSEVLATIWAAFAPQSSFEPSGVARESNCNDGFAALGDTPAAVSDGPSARMITASRRITGWQSGVAVAGDYMSAASFLRIAGLIAFYGYDGFMFSVGWLVAYLTVLLVVAEPLRNAGKYTMADVLAYRFNPRPVRAIAALSTITVSTLYMTAQMVGAAALSNSERSARLRVSCAAPRRAASDT